MTEPLANTMAIRFMNVSKTFASRTRGQTVIDNLELAIFENEFYSLLGPSGCGKTTALRMIAGFEHPSGGDILIDGQSVIGVPPYRRNVNMVFQSYSLFPHMTVYDNIEYGLRRKGVARAERRRRIDEVVALSHLQPLLERRPGQLSGGQQQRVALARALVNRPRVLLLDEPLAALDAQLRASMQTELRRLQKEIGITFVFVTHDQQEAFALSDRVAVMRGGRLEQVGTPADLYSRPATRFVASFVGLSNFITAEVSAADPRRLADFGASGRVMLDRAVKPGSYTLVVRPERVAITKTAPDPTSAELSLLCGRVVESTFLGSRHSLKIKTPLPAPIIAETGDQTPALPGDEVWLSWRTADGALIDDERPAP